MTPALDEDKSTPPPWPEPVYDNHGNGYFSEWWDIPGVARFDNEADAILAREAVNNYDAMKECVEALKELVDGMGGKKPLDALFTLADQWNAARSALAKLEGQVSRRNKGA